VSDGAVALGDCEISERRTEYFLPGTLPSKFCPDGSVFGRRTMREDRSEQVVGANPRVEGLGQAVERLLPAGPLVERRSGDAQRLARSKSLVKPWACYP